MAMAVETCYPTTYNYSGIDLAVINQDATTGDGIIYGVPTASRTGYLIWLTFQTQTKTWTSSILYVDGIGTTTSGSYGASTAKIEYSKDGGNSWSSTGFPILTGTYTDASLSGARSIGAAPDLSQLLVRLYLRGARSVDVDSLGEAYGTITGIRIEGIYTTKAGKKSSCAC